MASQPIKYPTAFKAVEEAVSGLIKVSGWGDYAYVNLPIFMPAGAPATVRVRRKGDEFEVDDGGYAYRELESIGAERSFPKVSEKVAALEELEKDTRRIFASCSEAELTRAICDVAIASRNVVAEVFSRFADADSAEIEDYLQERLASVFGPKAVEPGDGLIGASTKKWDMSAKVHLDSGLIVFQAVSNHAHSVNRASTAFHDLRELPNPPTLVAVVKDKEAMGANIGLLSQAGRVIQSDQPDEVYKRAAA